VADDTGIEWADATWNPVVGCSVLSPGCTHCYAMRFAAARLDGNPKTPHYLGTTQRVNGQPVWTGRLGLAPEHVWTQPLRWKRPRRIFVNSMGDLFHENVPPGWLDHAFDVMARASQHTFLILTKRAERARDWLSAPETRLTVTGDWASRPWPLPNVWLGVSVEDQRRADERVPVLLDTPAAVRFVSAEPLLGPIEFRRRDGSESTCWLSGSFSDTESGRAGRCVHGGIDWVIAGGESGKDARPMHPDWARGLRDQCAAAGVPFFFKQWGEWAPHDGRRLPSIHTFDDCTRVFRVGKTAAGRHLDGVTHDAFPAREGPPQG
jgi:protein gp37